LSTKKNDGLHVHDIPWDEYVRDILILAKKRQVKKDLDRFRIRCQDDQLTDTAVQRLGGLIGSLFDLFVVGCLLDEIQQSDRKIGIGKREGFLGHGGKVVCLGIKEQIGTTEDYVGCRLLDGWDG
jgi:hypothetical protein